MRKLTGAIALTLAAIGAAVSLSGLALMFGLVFAMSIGVGLEVGKLTAADALHRNWPALGRLHRYTLSGIVVTLMVLTSSGIYGFTLTQYLAHVAAITAPAAERIAAADENVSRQAGKVADLTKQIADVDAAPKTASVTAAIKPVRASAIAAQAAAQAAAAKQHAAEDQRLQAKRDGLAGRRDIETAELSRLRGERTAVGSVQQAAEAEVGPVKVLADAIGVDPGKVVAGAVAILFDPLCVLLWLAIRSKPAEAVQAVPEIAATVAAPVAEIAPAAVAPAATVKKPVRKAKRKVATKKTARKRKPALKPDWRDTSDLTNVHYLVK